MHCKIVAPAANQLGGETWIKRSGGLGERRNYSETIKFD
jgi:hypothetical protein